MKFFETLKNIWQLEDLRKRILYTLGLVLIYRIGSYIVLPGVNPALLDDSGSGGGLLDIVNFFAGGAFSRASIFALGIMPYISASIVMQLVGMALPAFQKMQREGESGRRKFNQITRYLTVILTASQSIGYIIYIRSMAGGQDPVDPSLPIWIFNLSAVFCLTAGTLFVMWLGERITERGIGNGVSLLIMVGIVASLPGAMVAEFAQQLSGEGMGAIVLLLEFISLILVTLFVVALVQAIRKVPIQYARKVVSGGKVDDPRGARDYIPLKLNTAGVMPIIFAQVLMMVPATLFRVAGGSNSQFFAMFSDIQSWGYNLVFFVLIILFTYLYTAVTINPVQMADDLKRNNAFVPKVSPGEPTAEHFDTIMSRITLPGSVFLGVVAILPAFAMMAGVSSGFAIFFGGTSLLIMIGVVLDTYQQIESYLLNKEYSDLIKSGRTKSRDSVNIPSGF